MHLTKISIFPETFPTQEYYPFNLGILQGTRDIEFTTPVTFFIGENGSGKSTLLKAIARRCGVPIWKGSERTRLHINKYEERLCDHIQIEWAAGRVPGSFFASEVFHDFAQVIDEWARDDPGILKYFGGESFMSKSHGQCHMAFFESRFQIKGVYFLDEPENALSPKKQLELLQVLQTTAQSGHAQFIIATHSPLLLALPGAVINSFDSIPVRRISYEETAYYKIYKDFLNHREQYFQALSKGNS